MSIRGIQSFYYTRLLPSRAVAIAKLSTPPYTPAQLTDIHNTPYLDTGLGVWKGSSVISSAADFVAKDLGVPLAISGDSDYFVDNYTFDLTPISLNNQPLFYYHDLPNANVTDVRFLDANGSILENVASLQVGNRLYHDQDGSVYSLRFVDSLGFLHTILLQYKPAMRQGPFSPSDDVYVLSGRSLQVATTSTLWIRFRESGGYRVLAPYDTVPNAPWFPRIRFAIAPPAPEYYRQTFLPERPYVYGYWVKGKVLGSRLLELERKGMFFDGTHLPDILVFDKDNAIKYAIDGSPVGSPPRRGTFYPWKRGLIRFDGSLPSIDPAQARVETTVDLDPDDIVFGFYSYREQDLIYRALDVNPFTNVQVKDRVIQFYYKNNGADPFRYIYHQVLDSNANPIAGLTNDPNPGQGTKHVFGTMIVGASIGPNSFTVQDIRMPGGGLGNADQTIPEAVNFWDLGYWDGKPYPVGGVLIVHLPSSILNRMTQADVESKVKESLPAGVMPVIFYYNQAGAESR